MPVRRRNRRRRAAGVRSQMQVQAKRPRRRPLGDRDRLAEVELEARRRRSAPTPRSRRSRAATASASSRPVGCPLRRAGRRGSPGPCSGGRRPRVTLRPVWSNARPWRAPSPVRRSSVGGAQRPRGGRRLRRAARQGRAPGRAAATRSSNERPPSSSPAERSRPSSESSSRSAAAAGSYGPAVLLVRDHALAELDEAVRALAAAGAEAHILDHRRPRRACDPQARGDRGRTSTPSAPRRSSTAPWRRRASTTFASSLGGHARKHACAVPSAGLRSGERAFTDRSPVICRSFTSARPARGHACGDI